MPWVLSFVKGFIYNVATFDFGVTMSRTMASRLRKYGHWVLFAWVLSLMGPLVVPTQPVVKDNFVVLRVCTLMNGVQFIKVPLSNYSDNQVKDHISQLHASCKCGLNVDHASFVMADIALPSMNFAPVRWAIPNDERVIATFVPHYLSRAPPVTA